MSSVPALGVGTNLHDIGKNLILRYPTPPPARIPGDQNSSILKNIILIKNIGVLSFRGPSDFGGEIGYDLQCFSTTWIALCMKCAIQINLT